jgi:hypothetical protein
MPWTTPKTDWDTNPTSPLPSDFNRIEGNIEFLNTDIETKKGLIVDALNSVGIAVLIADTHVQLASKITSAEKIGISITPGTVNQEIPKGIYDTGGGLVVGDPGLISANIKAGVNIFGVSGNSSVVDTSPGTAVAADILSGKIAFVDGVLITGTIPSKLAATITPGTTNQQIAAGQYLSGIQTIAGDAELISANIKAGANIFGVAGNANIVDTSAGTAVAGDILASKIAFVDGAQVTGSMVERGTVNQTLTTQGGSYTIPAGRHSGSGVITASLSNLSSGNVKEGVNVGGIVGTLEAMPQILPADYVVQVSTGGQLSGSGTTGWTSSNGILFSTKAQATFTSSGKPFMVYNYATMQYSGWVTSYTTVSSSYYNVFFNPYKATISFNGVSATVIHYIK